VGRLLASQPKLNIRYTNRSATYPTDPVATPLTPRNRIGPPQCPHPGWSTIKETNWTPADSYAARNLGPDPVLAIDPADDPHDAGSAVEGGVADRQVRPVELVVRIVLAMGRKDHR
jgi:hypothetical protein